MTRLVAADLVSLEGAVRPGLAMEIAADAVVRVRPLATSEIPDLHVRLIGPALTDLQLNGSGGVMLNFRRVREQDRDKTMWNIRRRQLA